MDASASSSSSSSSPDANLEADTPRTSLAVRRALQLIQSDDPDSKLQAARDIRRLTKTSQRCRRHLSDAVGPLVSMLRFDSPDAHEPALLALLNLAVKDVKYDTSLLCFHYYFFWIESANSIPD